MEKSLTLREFVSFLYHGPYKNVIKGNVNQIRVSLNGNDVDLACSISDIIGESFGKYLKVHAPELKAFYYSTDKLPNQIRYYIGEKDCTVAQFLDEFGRGCSLARLENFEIEKNYHSLYPYQLLELPTSYENAFTMSLSNS